MRAPEPITDELLRKTLQSAQGGDVGPLIARLSRSSGLPNRPNWGFARLVAGAIAAERAPEALLRALLDAREPFAPIVAAFALALRIGASLAPARGAGAARAYDAASDVALFERAAGDERRVVREGAVLALRELLAREASHAKELFALLAPLEAGLLHAAVLCEAVGERTVLDRLRDGSEVVRVLEAAVTRSDGAARSEERLQGLRELRLRLPEAIAAASARFHEVLAWLEGELLSAKAAAEAPLPERQFMRPETRALWLEALRLLGRNKLGAADVERLRALGGASAKPVRDLARVVEGTRRRGSRRR